MKMVEDYFSFLFKPKKFQILKLSGAPEVHKGKLQTLQSTDLASF